MGILDELGKKILFCDGGLGSLLQEKGLKPGELPETWNLTKPEVLIDIHKAYLEAGADIINANTFGANRFKFDNLEEIICAAFGSDGMKRFDIGAGLRFGVEIKNKYTLSIGYDKGFIDTYNSSDDSDDEYTIDLTPSLKNTNLTFSFGYRF